jgi:hypothetical protein
MGDMPLLCSEGFNSGLALELLDLAGLKPAAHRFHFRAGEELSRLSEVASSLDCRLVFQHAYPSGPLDDRCWIDPRLLCDLNNKAKLAELVPPGSAPSRRAVESASYFNDGDHALPAVLKVVTDQSNGGGRGVAICRNASDLKSAASLFGKCERIVVEEILEIERNPCLNFAVMSDGKVSYLGFADQDVTRDGKYQGNWIDRGSSIPESAVNIAMEAAKRGSALGYRGIVGVDLAITPEGLVYVLDLNFRLNGCTSSILLADAVAERTGAGTMHFRTLRTPADAGTLASLLRPHVAGGRLVPLNFFDPAAAGYSNSPSSVQTLVLGSSRAEVLAIEADLIPRLKEGSFA